MKHHQQHLLWLIASCLILTSCTNYGDLVGNCHDGHLTEGEIEVDCGGVCPPCTFNCNNGIMDDDEEGIDCGGSCPNSCPINLPCTPDDNRIIKYEPGASPVTANIFETSTDATTVRVFSYIGAIDIRFSEESQLPNSSRTVTTIGSAQTNSPPQIAFVKYSFVDGTQSVNAQVLPDQSVYFVKDSTSTNKFRIYACQLEFDNGLKLDFNAIWYK